jgi:putative sporulation protein YyaC
MEFSFNLYNQLAPAGLSLTMKRLLSAQVCDAPPVILCVGSDLSIGDCLGPIAGTMIKNKLFGLNVYVYGTLAKPITAHEVGYMNEFIRATHPNSKVVAIDAAVGSSGDIGLIKIAGRGLKPGSGANKKLGKVGDVSLMGVVAEKSLFNYSLFSATRLNMVFRMAEIISDGVANFVISSLQSGVETAITC